MIIGVDNGNSNTKTKSSVFVSGLVVSDKKPPMARETIKYKGKFYSLSDKRLPAIVDKTESLDCFVLTLFAISKEILKRDEYDIDPISVSLSVGLPPEHFIPLRDKFENYFLENGKMVEFIYNDRPFKISISNVYVFPQGYPATMLASEEILKYSGYFIVDIGGFTTDVLKIVNGYPDLSVCESLEMGAILMAQEIRKRVSANFPGKIEDSHVFDVLNGKKTVLEPKMIEMIQEESKKYAATIIRNLREIGVDLKTNPCLFLGGTSILLKEHLETSPDVVECEFIEDVSANAQGYEILAKHLEK